MEVNPAFAAGEATTTESGLQILVVTEGEGATPGPASNVEVHYRGGFENGEEFDSSYDRGQTIEFPVNGVIKGWTEALMTMKEGASVQVCIPPDLGYGAAGAGGVIPPNATLYFDIELIKVK